MRLLGINRRELRRLVEAEVLKPVWIDPEHAKENLKGLVSFKPLKDVRAHFRRADLVRYVLALMRK